MKEPLYTNGDVERGVVYGCFEFGADATSIVQSVLAACLPLIIERHTKELKARIAMLTDQLGDVTGMAPYGCSYNEAEGGFHCKAEMDIEAARAVISPMVGALIVDPPAAVELSGREFKKLATALGMIHA